MRGGMLTGLALWRHSRRRWQRRGPTAHRPTASTKGARPACKPHQHQPTHHKNHLVADNTDGKLSGRGMGAAPGAKLGCHCRTAAVGARAGSTSSQMECGGRREGLIGVQRRENKGGGHRRGPEILARSTAPQKGERKSFPANRGRDAPIQSAAGPAAGPTLSLSGSRLTPGCCAACRQSALRLVPKAAAAVAAAAR